MLIWRVCYTVCDIHCKLMNAILHTCYKTVERSSESLLLRLVIALTCWPTVYPMNNQEISSPEFMEARKIFNPLVSNDHVRVFLHQDSLRTHTCQR